MSDVASSINASAALAAVKDEIARAAREADRDPASVTLIAVSKTFGADAIEPVIAAGQRVFGENRVQEAKAKWPALRRRASGARTAPGRPAAVEQGARRRSRCSMRSIRSTGRASREALGKEIAKQGRAPAPVRRDQYRRGAAEGRRAAGRDADAFMETLPRRLRARHRGPDVHSAVRGGAGAAFRAHRQDRGAQRPEAALDGDERGFSRPRSPSARPMCGSARRFSASPGAAQKKSPDAGLGG